MQKSTGTTQERDLVNNVKHPSYTTNLPDRTSLNIREVFNKQMYLGEKLCRRKCC